MRSTLALLFALTAGCSDPLPPSSQDGGIDPQCVDEAGPGTVRAEWIAGICAITCDRGAPWVTGNRQQCGVRVDTVENCGAVGARCLPSYHCQDIGPGDAGVPVNSPMRYRCQP